MSFICFDIQIIILSSRRFYNEIFSLLQFGLFSSHALFFLYLSFCGHISLLCHLSFGISSTTVSTSQYGRTSVTWSLLAGPIFQSCYVYFTHIVETPRFLTRWDVSEFRCIFWRLNVRYILQLIASEKILALAGLERHSVELKIS